VLDHKLTGVEFLAICTTLILTLFLNACFMFPRLIGLGILLGALAGGGNPLDQHALVTIALYEVAEFLFAVLAALLAVASSRMLFRSAATHIVCASATGLLLLYALITLAMHGRVPMFFFPVYLDLAASLPGWLIGFLVAGGSIALREYGAGTFFTLGGLTTCVVAAVVIAPIYVPFYVRGGIIPMQRDARLPIFHHVSAAPSNAASSLPVFTPMPTNSAVPQFHTVLPNSNQ
jgi:hypothetical protein